MVLPVVLISGDTLVDTFQTKDLAAEVVSVEGDAVIATADDHPQVSTSLTAFSQAPKVGDTIHVTPTGKSDGVTSAVAFEPNSWNEMKPYTQVTGNPGLALLLFIILNLRKVE